MKLTLCEREVLEMVAGTRPWTAWGAWIGACLDTLYGSGLITSYIGAMPKLTDAGRRALAADSGEATE